MKRGPLDLTTGLPCSSQWFWWLLGAASIITLETISDHLVTYVYIHLLPIHSPLFPGSYQLSTILDSLLPFSNRITKEGKAKEQFLSIEKKNVFQMYPLLSLDCHCLDYFPPGSVMKLTEPFTSLKHPSPRDEELITWYPECCSHAKTMHKFLRLTCKKKKILPL